MANGLHLIAQGIVTTKKLPPFGASKHTVAMDRRAAKKRRAVKRAKRLGHWK